MMHLAAIALTGLFWTPGPLLDPASIDQPTSAPAAPIASGLRPISEFVPSQHGFKFGNSFTGSPLPIKLGGIEHSMGVPSRYGLCGGMSFAAADCFLARCDIPAATKPPADGTPLFKFISRRQSQSLGEGMKGAIRFAQWMAKPDGGFAGTRELTLGEIPEVVKALDRGEPAHLGLVFSKRGGGNDGEKKGGGAVWENHQVLAYGASRRSPTCIDLKIYDPNYPGADGAVIRCRIAAVSDDLAAPLGGWRVPVLGAICERVVPGHRTTPVRGVFRMPYTAQVPPANVAQE